MATHFGGWGEGQCPLKKLSLFVMASFHSLAEHLLLCWTFTEVQAGKLQVVYCNVRLEDLGKWRIAL